ncbi:MAG: PAS domain S-box protein [Nitrospirae bacterium]|nr:MAG: PAS domain S-box protein [Nitrospirota bacterium]
MGYFSPGEIFTVIFFYLLFLFVIAFIAEKQEQKRQSLVANPYIYSLSLAVYCTSWTFYGSVGKAATEGLSFLAIYTGPTLMAALWPIVLRKMITVAKENGITTISDFIGVRYGRSLGLSALVTVVAVAGITPYISLQLKAIMTTFSIITARPEGSHFAGWLITLMLGIFAIVFGARKLDASERHGGMVFAVAFESMVKLMAFLAVGIFVFWGVLKGPAGLQKEITQKGLEGLLRIGQGSGVSYVQWFSLTFLSMMAILLLPRQFHVAVVENSSVEHIRKAMWLFPLYLFLINLFVVPIAIAGLKVMGTKQGADYFVLFVPLKKGYPYLALFAFLGGFSAATAMVIVESLALSTMVTNSIVLPLLFRFRHMKGFHQVVLNLKRITIVGIIFLGYLFAIYVGEFYSLVDIGLKSFEAVTILAPSVLLGLYWRGANKKGAIAGIVSGFVIWLYTLLVPALVRAGLLQKKGILYELFSSSILNPTSLFGLHGLDRWSHSLFWGLGLNLFFFVGFSIITRQSEEETRGAISFVDAYMPEREYLLGRFQSIEEIEAVLGRYIGYREAHESIESFIRRSSINRKNPSEREIAMVRAESERILSGALGPSLSAIVMSEVFSIPYPERARISRSIQELSRSLTLSRKELAEANRQLARLKEFSESIIESIPLGVATMDESFRVTFWNRAMEKLTGVKKEDALQMEAHILLKCLEPDIFANIDKMLQGEFQCRIQGKSPLLFKGILNKLHGQAKGYVLVLEDITEKKRIEEELFRAAKHASVGRLAAGVSHEIGNPLASISSLVQELMAEDLSDFARGSLSEINAHIERIARIVRSLGDFARIQPRQRQKTDLKELLQSTINLARYDKGFKKIDVRFQASDVPPLKVDRDQLQQVFLNIILNARDAMAEGGTLTINLMQRDTAVEVSFTDTGVGIDREILDKIFDPFFTTKGPSRGMGLGLSICYGIIKDHNGSIEVSSEKGKGTTFTVRLPLEDVSNDTHS